jgi:hypothetical protein
MELVVVRTYSHAMEAQMACGALQAAGIDARIADEHLVTQDWLLSNVVGGVRLQVPASQIDDARSVIGEIDAPAPADAPMVCPNCESENTEFAPVTGLKKAILILLAIATVGLVLLMRPAYKRCHDCGARWG